MLRTYLLQQWFGLSDPGMEQAFYESAVLRRFAGVGRVVHRSLHNASSRHAAVGFGGIHDYGAVVAGRESAGVQTA